MKRLTLKMMKLSMKILRGSMVGTKVTMNVEREKNEDLEAKKIEAPEEEENETNKWISLNEDNVNKE